MSERMIFCFGEGRWEEKGAGYQKNNMVFNQSVSEEEFDTILASLPTIELPITKWIEEKDMTKDEKDNLSDYKQAGGYLKPISYEDAWAKVWAEMSKDDKKKITSLKQFDSEIFKSITEIEVEKNNKKEKPKEIEINGATYVLKDSK